MAAPMIVKGLLSEIRRCSSALGHGRLFSSIGNTCTNISRHRKDMRMHQCFRATRSIVQSIKMTSPAVSLGTWTAKCQPKTSMYSQITTLCGSQNLNRQSKLQRDLHKLENHESDLTLVNVEQSAWIIRLANENGYLSWCRNVYLATAVAAAIYVQTDIPYAHEAAMVILMMGGLNLAAGTSVFIYNIVTLRNRVLMSSLTVLYNVAMALTHLVLWFGAMAIYIGYVEEDTLDTEEKEDEV